MFYRKRKTYRRRFAGRRRTGRASWGSYFRRGVSAVQNIASLWSAIRSIKGKINSEMYKLDQSQTGVNLSTTGGVIHCTAVAQGDGDGNRTGNSIFCRALNIKGVLQFNASSAVLSQAIRLIVVRDVQQVGDTSPTCSNLLESITTYSHLNSDTVGRFKVLYNHVFTVDTQNGVMKPFQINLPLYSHARFNGTASTDIQKGGIYFMVLSNVAAASNPPTMDYEMRLSYHDN